MASPEERLLDIVVELRDTYEVDMEKQAECSERGNLKDLDAHVLYPQFMKVVKLKTEELKEAPDKDYRRLCSVPSFALGLVKASHIRRHYTHASWFKTEKLGEMLGSHGGVSETCMINIVTGQADENKVYLRVSH